MTMFTEFVAVYNPNGHFAAKTVVDLTPYCIEPAIADVALPLSGNRLRDLAMLFATETT
jgi:hypothetical protein